MIKFCHDLSNPFARGVGVGKHPFPRRNRLHGGGKNAYDELASIAPGAYHDNPAIVASHRCSIGLTHSRLRQHLVLVDDLLTLAE